MCTCNNAIPQKQQKTNSKEALWPHVREFADRAISHVAATLGRLAAAGEVCELYAVHGHYADAGEAAALVACTLGVDMVLTGHSLGRNKLEHLLKSRECYLIASCFAFLHQHAESDGQLCAPLPSSCLSTPVTAAALKNTHIARHTTTLNDSTTPPTTTPISTGTMGRREIEAAYAISRRIEAEERGLDCASLVFTSTRQEVRDQWGLYDG